MQSSMPEDNLKKPETLPDSVQTLKALEQSKSSSQPALTTETVSLSETNSKPTNLQDKLRKLAGTIKRQHIIVKVVGVAVLLVFTFLFIAAILTLTAVDGQIMKLTLAGTVIDKATREPVAGATVMVGSAELTTDNLGTFSLGQLEIQRYQVKITAPGYETYNQEVAMSRSFLDYTVERTFELQPAGEASVSGKFVSPDSTYQFLDDTIMIGESVYKPKIDGTFEIDDVETGEQILKFMSVSYKDVELEIELKGGANTLEGIVLVPAGDIVGNATSWLREDIVPNLKITVEGIPAEQITLDSEGEFRVRDLEVAKKYKVRTQADGYVEQDYDVSIDQGENNIFGFKLVENGKIPFIRKVNRYNQLFVSDYNGDNALQLTSENNFDPRGEFIKGSEVYFLSSRDNVINNIGSGKGLTAYVASISGGSPQRLTTDVEDIGNIYPSFAGTKLINLAKGETSTSRVLQVMSLAGTNRATIQEISEGNINDPQLSTDGKVIYYQMQNKDGSMNGLYRSDTTSAEPERIANKENIQIYSVNSNGDKVIYSAKNEGTKLLDLFIYTHSTKQDTLLRAAFTGSQYQFASVNNDLVLFHDFRDGGNNVYQLQLSTNKESRLTNFSGTEGVDAIYQQSGLMIYQTNKGIYLMDLTKPVAGKLITDDFVRYTGYDF